MTCIRHSHCRHGIYARIKAWPTATHPRYFAVACLGSAVHLFAFAYLAAFPFLMYWLLTVSGVW